MRTGGIATSMAIIGILAAGATTELRAQTVPPVQARASADNRIAAGSSPYRIEWNGASGVFIRAAFAQEPEVRQPMAFLHTDAGPAGFAKYLAWFLARDAGGFSLLWCYLNNSGTEFDCWLYRFPSNQLTSLHFTGPYQFAPPAEPVPPLPMGDLKLTALPTYAGADFTYRDWTRVVGGLPTLDLQATRQTATPAALPAAGATSKTVTQLRIRPLHRVEVGSANGWREGGWNELHALAFDAAEDPYYLILYSNTTKGYAVDLKRAQIYTADFGAKVGFSDSAQSGSGDPASDAEPEIKVRRYDRHEIVLTTKEITPNPYVSVQVGVEFRGPDTKPILVPGFWDGGGSYRIRFTPTLAGKWTWRSLSKVTDLNGQTGAFECVNEEPAIKGFINVQPHHQDPHHFAYANGDPFLPVLLREPMPSYSAMRAPGRAAAAARTGGVQLTGLGDDPTQDETGAFVAYQRFISAAAQKGFNRLIGGRLLGTAAAKLVRSNEGGPALESTDLGTINPAFFQWMDRRIAYCNARGIVPDIGIGTLEDALFTTYAPESLYRFWAYVVARYSSYDVQWNLFEPGETPPSEQTRKGAEQFAELTRLYDPNHHPITLIVSGGATRAAPIIAPAIDSGDAPEPAVTPPSGIPGRGGRGGRQAPRTDGSRPAPSTNARAQASSSALGGGVAAPKQAVPYDLPWEDVITLEGGDVNALPWYTWIQKPLVMVERPTVDQATALTPDVTRHRMWEARMRGAYWAPGVVPSVNVSALNAPEIQWAAYCANLFRRTRFSRLFPRPEMLGGPTESPADRRRRKKAEAAAPKQNPPPPDPSQPPTDFDPFDPELFGDLPPLPVPKPTPMFVLADPAHEYVVYFEQGGTLLLDLLEATGKVQATWFNPRTGEYGTPKQLQGGAYVPFSAPDANDWVLYIARL